MRSGFISFLGICGLVLIIFGIVFALVASDQYIIWSQAQQVAGALLVVLYLCRGGVQSLAAAVVGRKARHGAGTMLYSALFVGVLVVVNYIVVLRDPLHYDSTEQKVYTLAPQTEKVLKALPQKVLIRAFYVGGEVDKEVSELLDRMVKAGSALSWKVVDPEKSPRLVEELGISERSTLHFALDVEGSTRGTKVSRNITEQDIVNAILKLTRGGAKKVYSIYGHGESNLEEKGEAGFLFLKEAIEGENLQVEQLVLAGKDAIPSDAAAILLLAPRRALLESERELIRKYLSAGGSALMLNEPKTAADVRDLSQPFGIEVGNDVVLDEIRRNEIGVQTVVSQYGQHAITEDFRQNTVFATMSSVKKSGAVPEGATVAEVAYTSKESWAEKNLDLLYSDKAQAAIDPDDIKGPVPVAVAYDGPPVGSAAEADGKAAEKKPERRSRIVVIGDADFVANINIRQLFNRDFFLNALNWTVAQEERVSIRARTMRTSVKTITTEQFQGIFLICAIIVPECVLLLGLGVWWFRKR